MSEGIKETNHCIARTNANVDYITQYCPLMIWNKEELCRFTKQISD